MFSPLGLVGRSVHTLEGIDNAAINEAVIKRRGIKLDESLGNTFYEDSFYPDTEACNHLIQKVDAVIALEVNRYFVTQNKWAHILAPGESTMYHSHGNPKLPTGISWVYYTQVPKDSGNIVWTFDMCTKRVMQELEPKPGMLVLFPDFVPHFTKRNGSSKDRVSISGNAYPAQEDYDKVGRDPQNLFNYIGIFAE